MKWVDLINSKLKNSEIRVLMKENDSIDTLIKNLPKYNEKIKYEIDYCYTNPLNLTTDKYRVISYFDDEYPKLLKYIPDFPTFLYLTGKKLNILNSVAVVGTRNYTNIGKLSCEKIITDLSEYEDISIISGLAKGIDTIALEKAIKLNLHPISVIPTDILSCYPKENLALIREIAKVGTVISEFRIGESLKKSNFVIRNRVIAGLSRAVYVAQSFKSGGSMITAKIAMEYDREVYCTPSNIFDKSFEGCNDLIMKNLAKLINSGHDIGYEYGWRKKSEKISSNSGITFKG